MKVSTRGIDLIKKAEGERLTAYVCPAGVLTIGVGHTGPDVKRGQTITAAQSDALLRKDLAHFEVAVAKAVKVPLTQNQFDALVSLVFNIGAGNFASSTLLRKLNAGDYAGAAAQFGAWNKGRVGGKLTVLPGLTTRRKAEAALFGEGA